jgi:hypothetical protein
MSPTDVPQADAPPDARLQVIVDAISVLRGRIQVGREPLLHHEERWLRALVGRGADFEEATDPRCLGVLERCAVQWESFSGELPLSERLVVRALARLTRDLVAEHRPAA